MSIARGSLVVVGSGPGIGVATSSLFASKGFSLVALLSRKAERLRSDAASIHKFNPSAEVKTYSVDVGDHTTLHAALEAVERDMGPPEVVLFNAARVAPSELGHEPPEDILKDFRVTCLGIYVTMSWAKSHLVAMAKQPGARPCFFLSGGTIYRNPLPEVFSLSMQKAAQHNLMMSFSKVVGPLGVHVADLSISGEVRDDDPVTSAANIAKEYWKLYEEVPPQWRFQPELGETAQFSLSSSQT